MVKSFIIIAYRNLLRHKVFSLINISGLSIGIAASLLLLQYVSYERSYDTFHTNVKNIYRIQHDTYKNGVLENTSAISYYGAGVAIKETFAEVTDMVRLHRADGMFSYYNDNGDVVSHYEKKAFYADPSFFRIFSFPLITGDKNKVLRTPNSLVISESAAKKYFGSYDPLGKIISLSTEWEGGQYVVEGVFKDVPEYSHIKFDFIFSIHNLLKNKQFKNGAWYWTNFYTYLLLKPNTEPIIFQQKLSAVIDTHLGSHLRKTNSEEEFVVQPLKDIHLYSNIGAETEVNGDHKLVSFLLIISFFIVGIAWLNYINLSTAKATERAREVGIRKVLGSYKIQLVKQFLLESSILTMISVFIGVGIFAIAAPLFDELAGKKLELDFSGQVEFWIASLLIILFGSFLAGIYPAFIISSFNPIAAIKGKFIRNIASVRLRKVMVVFQFGAAMLLIISTMTVSKQLEFMRSHDLGISINHKIIIRAPRLIKGESYLNAMDQFKNKLLIQSDIKSVSASSEVPGKEIFWTNEFRLENEPENVRRLTSILAVDEDFVPTYEIRLLAGRNFMKNRPSDYGGTVIINESALRRLGIQTPEAAINQKLIIGNEFKTIIGVITDFHQQSLRQSKNPTIIQYIPWSQDYLTLSVNSKNVRQTISIIEKAYGDVFPDNAFEYFFLDDQFNQQYQAEDRMWKIFILFSALAIVVSCMGLFGLSSFLAIQRTKEVAIRKVLGASVSNITTLLSTDFISLVFVSFAIAGPVSWYVMNQWLEGFAYRIDIPWLMFILSGTLTAVIAFLTVSFQSVKAALKNPIDSIKVE